MAAVAMKTEPVSKETLASIDAEIEQIALAFDQLEATGEHTEVLTSLESYFGGLLEQRDRKLDAYAGLIRRYEFLAKNRKAEADRIAALAKTDENNAKRLRERLKFYFDEKGITNLETPLNKFGIQKNGGLAPLKVVEDELPDEFVITFTKPDNEKIREALDSGRELDFAWYEERGTSLRIR